MRKRIGLFLLLSLVVTGLLFVSWVTAEEDNDKLPIVPDFKLKNLEGERIALSDLLGKGPILISFWATWCKPCIKELPHLQELYEKYKDRGFLVVAISEDAPRSVSKVRSFIAGKRYTFLVLLDDNNSVQRKLNFRAIPYTMLLDKEGHIVHKRMGYRPGDERLLEEEFLSLIEVPEERERMAEEEKKDEGTGQTAEDEQGEQEQGEGEKGSAEQERGERKYIKKVKKEWAKIKSAEGRDE